ncbi:MAG: dihydropteroate synthase [Clostridiales bacterium]|nr:dihydropteroate synthase [Clostridiales bacterium]
MSNTFKGKEFSFDLGKKTYIMGILNVTPDSFSDGGDFVDADKAVEHALEMARDGADIIDIGAQSTRPGHTPVSAEEEMRRLKPVLQALKDKNLVISVDTYYPEVAKFALEISADIINDVSGEFNSEMAQVVKEYGAGWILMHTGGKSASETADYDGCVTDSVNEFFDDVLLKAKEYAIPLNNICLDCGIGFGKSYEDNLELLQNADLIKRDNIALLYAVSRKRVIGTATMVDEPKQRLYGTIAANTAAIMGGADIIRVHDVKECSQAAKMIDAIIMRG